MIWGKASKKLPSAHQLRFDPVTVPKSWRDRFHAMGSQAYCTVKDYLCAESGTLRVPTAR